MIVIVDVFYEVLGRYRELIKIVFYWCWFVVCNRFVCFVIIDFEIGFEVFLLFEVLN